MGAKMPPSSLVRALRKGKGNKHTDTPRITTPTPLLNVGKFVLVVDINANSFFSDPACSCDVGGSVSSGSEGGALVPGFSIVRAVFLDGIIGS
jgi:hypothetical protein